MFRQCILFFLDAIQTGTVIRNGMRSSGSGPTSEFRWPRKQPSAFDSIFEVEKHSIAAHLPRLVRRRELGGLKLSHRQGYPHRYIGCLAAPDELDQCSHYVG